VFSVSVTVRLSFVSVRASLGEAPQGGVTTFSCANAQGYVPVRTHESQRRCVAIMLTDGVPPATLINQLALAETFNLSPFWLTYLLLVMTIIRIIAAASFLAEERDAEYRRRREGTIKRLQEKEQKKARQRQALEGGADLVIDLEFGDLMEPHVRLGFSNTAFSFSNCLLFPSAHQAALSFQTDQECEMHLNCFLSFPTNKTTCLRRCFLVRPDSSGTQVTLQASFLPRDESIVCTLVML
jgi:hypothetical protein